MNLTQALEARVSRAAAEAEIRRHDWTWHQLKREAGYEPERGEDGRYSGREILTWLGY